MGIHLPQMWLHGIGQKSSRISLFKRKPKIKLLPQLWNEIIWTFRK